MAEGWHEDQQGTHAEAGGDAVKFGKRELLPFAFAKRQVGKTNAWRQGWKIAGLDLRA